MNKLIGGIALLLLVGGGGSSAHADGPWCASTTPRPIIAASTASSSAMRPYAGRADRAGPIFSKAMLSPSRQDGARHQADVTDSCRTSGLRRAGKRGSVSIEHVMEDARTCAVEPSADLLQPCSLPPPLASASRRRMPVHAAAGSRNSSRRCASPREIRTPGRWRRNRLAHSSIVQPTPASVRRAEQQAQATFAATLARAKRLDAQGNRAGCTRALAAARRMYNL